MRMSDMTAKTAEVPQQSFNAANIIGTPVPKVGDQQMRPPYKNAVGSANTSKLQTVGVAAVLIVGGYVGYHLLFEK